MIRIKISYEDEKELTAFLRSIPTSWMGRIRKALKKAGNYYRAYAELYPSSKLESKEPHE